MLLGFAADEMEKDPFPFDLTRLPVPLEVRADLVSRATEIEARTHGLYYHHSAYVKEEK